ncbi:MAG: manganese efflux pump MntP family protein [Treponema sp.]|jgi:putative Mn2+ efflux pump MntP|nr:manganese efflux pump MntP family protein [Treponema sp.]
MGLVEIVFIAIGLAMDAFAVSITLGLSVQKPKLREILIPGVYFGVFQSLMPAIGYVAGVFFVQHFEDLDHWIAFTLLGFIGGKMIKDSFSKEKGTEESDSNPFGCINMLILAVATSIDALAAGTTFAFFKVTLYTAILITGPVTFFIAMGGVLIGNSFGTRFKSKAEFAGGAVLIIIGIKTVIEHLLF